MADPEHDDDDDDDDDGDEAHSVCSLKPHK